MATEAAVRQSFAEAPLPSPVPSSLLFGQGGAGLDGGRRHVRVRRAGGGAAGSTAAPPPGFVFRTPGGPSGNGGSAVRRPGSRRGRLSPGGRASPAANLFGASPGDSCVSMAWSPYSMENHEETSTQSGSAAQQQAKQEQQQQQDGTPTSAPAPAQAAAPVAAPRPPAEQFARMGLHPQSRPAEALAGLHLGSTKENMPQQQQAEKATADEAALPHRLHTQLHVTGSQDLPQAFAAKVSLEAAAAAAAASTSMATAAAKAPTAPAATPGGDAAPVAAAATQAAPAPPQPQQEQQQQEEQQQRQQQQPPTAGSASPLGSPPPAVPASKAGVSQGSSTFVFSAVTAAPGAAAGGKRVSRSPTPTSNRRSSRSPRQAAATGAARPRATPAQQQVPEEFVFGQAPTQHSFVFGAAAAPSGHGGMAQAVPPAVQQHAEVARPLPWKALAPTLPSPVFGEAPQQQQQQQQPVFVSLAQAGGAASASRGEGSASRRARARRRPTSAPGVAVPAPSAALTTGSAPAGLAVSGAGGRGARMHLPRPPAFAVPLSQQQQQQQQHYKRSVTEAAPPPTAGLGGRAAQAKAEEEPLDGSTFAGVRSESHRAAGNEAFRLHRYAEAAELYSQAIQALWPHPRLHHRLALLLSNRAATALALGRPAAALADCRLGLQHDPSFLRCALRMATVYTRLGQFPTAYATLDAQRQRLVAAGSCAAGANKAQQQQQQAEALAEVAAKEADVARHEATLLAALQALDHATPPPAAPSTVAAAAAADAAAAAAARTSSDRLTGGAEALAIALRQLEAAAPGVPHCEAALAARALALLRLGRLQEAAAACDCRTTQDDEDAAAVGVVPTCASAAGWRHWVRAQCSFHLGRYQEAVSHLEALHGVLAAAETAAEAAAVLPFGSTGTKGGAPLAPLVATGGDDPLLTAVVVLPTAADVSATVARLREAQRLRLAGNEFMQAGRYADAVRQYTSALEACEHSASFAALLHCNRGAAYQGERAWAHAVADCCRAKALDPGYAKAHSRLATLLTELRRHEEAAAELEVAAQLPGLSPGSKSTYQRRLAQARAAAQRPPAFRGYLGVGLLSGARQPHHYRLLGLPTTCTSEEVRRCFKKMALLLHPDKVAAACRFATALPLPSPGGNGGSAGTGSAAAAGAEIAGLEKEVRGRLQAVAGWLFKAAQEAAEALQNPERRRELDAELAEEEGPLAGRSGGARHHHTYGSAFGDAFGYPTARATTVDPYGASHGSSDAFWGFPGYGSSRPSTGGAGRYGQRPGSGSTRPSYTYYYHH